MAVNAQHLQHLMLQHAGALGAPVFLGGGLAGGGFWSKIKSAASSIGSFLKSGFTQARHSELAKSVTPMFQQALNQGVQNTLGAVLDGVESGNYRGIASGVRAANAGAGGNMRRQLVNQARQHLMRPVF